MKKIKKIWRKRRERIAHGGSEASLFLEIVKKRQKTDLTGRPITIEDARSYQFAHILPKGTYPEHRLNPDNIILVDSIEQHERVDREVAGLKYQYEQGVKKWMAIKMLRSLYNNPLKHLLYGNNYDA